MKLVLSVFLMVTGTITSYYYKRFSQGQRKVTAFIIGILLLFGWVYLIIRVI